MTKSHVPQEMVKILISLEKLFCLFVVLAEFSLIPPLFACTGGCPGNCPSGFSPGNASTTAPTKSEISTKTLKILLDSDSVIIVEIRIKTASETERIFHARILYLTDSQEVILKTLPGKNRLIVLYSRQIPDLSVFYAELLHSLGYPAVVLYREGFDQWLRSGNPVESTAEFLPLRNLQP
ncbi:MAG: rhodanese-like domain-containing protein [Candidatus Ozemobacteraceae bacterium]